MISCCSSTQLANHNRYYSQILTRIYSQNINSIQITEIPAKGFLVCVLYNFLKNSLHENYSSQVAETCSVVCSYQRISMAPKYWAQIF